MQPRIATLTVNPAVDLAMDVVSMRPGDKIRAFGEVYDPGGGGINVSRVLHTLGANTLAIFASGGGTGRFLKEMLAARAVPCRAVPIGRTTRISVTVHDQATGSEYRFVPQGPVIESIECERILVALAKVRADWLVASGSLSSGLPMDFYARVARLVRKRGMKFALDTSGEALKLALHAGIDLLKVSRGEFQTISRPGASDRESLGIEASRLAASGAASLIALTLGKEGAILATADRQIYQPAPAVQVRSSVGAGDSFLAGLVLGIARGQPLDEALRLATMTAAAAVMEAGTARVDVERMKALLDDDGRQLSAITTERPIDRLAT
jgi:6-phosphofructokinase 2